ncbi:ribonuclease Z [Dellaglioa sp. BT-FLS60]
MELEFLGTGAGAPAKNRNVTSIALKLLDERNSVWLFDAGEATQHQILQTTIKPRKIEKIFITHLHGDHIFGLPGLLSSRSFQGGNGPLTIYGPKGIKNFVRTSLQVSETKLSYTINFVELDKPGLIFEDDTFKVYFDYLDHRILSVGYRIIEHDYAGELQIDKLKELSVPSGPIYGELKAGKVVQLENGTKLDGHDFLGETKKGRIVAILGDTRKTKNSYTLANNADVLVHESTFEKSESRMARNYYHTTSAQAAEIAKKSNVKLLLLTHISARYVGKMAISLQNEARSIFKNTTVVRDFDIINIPFSQKEKADD